MTINAMRRDAELAASKFGGIIRYRIGWDWYDEYQSCTEEYAVILPDAYSKYQTELALYLKKYEADRAWARIQPCGWIDRGPSPQLGLMWAVWLSAKTERAPDSVNCEATAEPNRPDWLDLIVWSSR